MATNTTGKPSIMQLWDGLQPSKAMLVWACVGSVIATMVVGFTWGGWVTGGTSQKMAMSAGDDARAELASVICMENFNAAPDSSAKLVEFKALTDSYKKRQFVEAGGWAVMPGQTSADRNAINGCITALDT
ncbi:hypothetical protein HDIA_1006 [Hartmannibacter diazotrophicus]|uniref:Uncharacterized protein n=1 Tax=Hartmannibacter diazotrophicus TaxID=1482074 RepID=A0A2C9D2I3_9HYPH|nr:hypothetical protein [Hartmannibacter diazotrophicus]SON54547.1 hypothetical protein HDIA_1006 [Hartmannibacter diazotrophicus]